MELDYSPDQRAMGDEANRFLAAACPVTAVRRVLDDPAISFDEALWQRVAAQGWLGVAVSEAQGGLGRGQAELGALAEALGGALAPIPFAVTFFILAEALSLAGSAAQQQDSRPASRPAH